MTGKQLWDEIERGRSKRALIAAADDDELRRALGYGMNYGSSGKVERHCTLLRRELRHRGARIPVDLFQ